MSGPSPVPRRVKTPSWLDLRLALGVALVLASVLLGALILSRAEHTDQRVALGHDLSAGARLTADDLLTVRVQMPDTRADVYVEDPATVVGKVLSRSLSTGELLPLAALTMEQATTTVSVPLDAGAAPELRAGSLAEFWVSSKACRALVLLRQATVQQVRDSSGSFSSAGGQDVVLSVPPELAARVVGALALPDARITAGVLSGPAPADANVGLPALDGCGGDGS